MTLNSSQFKFFFASLVCVAVSWNVMADDGEQWLRAQLAPEWGADSLVASEGADFNRDWWKTFGDPLLDSLIAIGERNNYDVSAAARRIDMARSALKQARSAYYPQFGLSAGWNRTRTSGLLRGRAGEAATMSYFSGTADMSWEVDVFGKVRAQTRRSSAQVRVSAAEYDGVMVSLDAEIASTYIGLLVSRAQLDVARRHAASQKHILDITETRHRTGLVSKLDVAQANTMYYSTTASIPMLEASIDASCNSLALLLGTTRECLPAGVMEAHALPEQYQLSGLGAPLDLLRRRPDIVAARRNIEVAAASLGIARSAYLPSLSIAASFGTQAHAFGDLFTGPGFTYSVSPTLSWTLFDGLSRRAATASARQNMELEIDNYNMTVLEAVEEVRTAIARYSATLVYIERIRKVVENSEEEVRLSLDQYKQGLTDFYNVVEAQLTNLTYQNSLVVAKGDALTALINLYKALGGAYYNN